MKRKPKIGITGLISGLLMLASVVLLQMGFSPLIIGLSLIAFALVMLVWRSNP